MSTASAVSVGDADEGITRQITGVAAGWKDTDAVNVAQLKAITAASSTKVDTKGPNLSVDTTRPRSRLIPPLRLPRAPTR